MIVREYWPAFVDRDDEPRVQRIESVDEINSIPWIAEKGAATVDGMYVMRNGWVVAHIEMDAK